MSLEVIVAIVVVVVVVIAIVIVYYCCKSGHCNAKSHGKPASLSSISIGDDNAGYAGEACVDPGEGGGDDSGGDDINRGGDDGGEDGVDGGDGGGEDSVDGGEDCGGDE